MQSCRQFADKLFFHVSGEVLPAGSCRSHAHSVHAATLFLLAVNVAMQSICSTARYTLSSLVICAHYSYSPVSASPAASYLCCCCCWQCSVNALMLMMACVYHFHAVVLLHSVHVSTCVQCSRLIAARRKAFHHLSDILTSIVVLYLVSFSAIVKVKVKK